MNSFIYGQKGEAIKNNLSNGFPIVCSISAMKFGPVLRQALLSCRGSALASMERPLPLPIVDQHALGLLTSINSRQ